MQNRFMNLDQLRAFATAVDAGALDSAARRLHITPSAMSQRIRGLEAAAGTVLLQRSSPVVPTPAGEVVLRAARQMLLVEADAQARLRTAQANADLGGGEADPAAPVTLRIAVNADSLATWLRPLFAQVAQWPDVLLHLEVVDQDRAAELLTRGQVMAAISSRAKPAAGCSAQSLGAMRYTAVARRGLIERSHGRLERMPVVDFGGDDELQKTFLRSHGVRSRPPVHQVPSSNEFFTAVAAGLGWGMLPKLQLTTATAGDDTELVPVVQHAEPIDVALHLHRWKLESERLDRLCEAVLSLARTALTR